MPVTFWFWMEDAEEFKECLSGENIFFKGVYSRIGKLDLIKHHLGLALQIGIATCDNYRYWCQIIHSETIQ